MLNEVSLFVMQGCKVCPQMERLFQNMRKHGAISALDIIDVTENPELAKQHNIRSVPFYLINGVAFTGLKTAHEITQLLEQNQLQKWESLIKQELSDGQLDSVEQAIRNQPEAREAMMALLRDDQTELVVRIGLTAIIESLSEGPLLDSYESTFIEMAEHADERIAVDALYYLSLLNSPASLAALNAIARHGKTELREHARELIEESTSNQILH